ncbi:ABC transporter permease [Chloroflexota bacterium]
MAKEEAAHTLSTDSAETEDVIAAYAARRLVIAIPTLIGATLLVFLMLRVLPGDVAGVICRGESGEGACSAETLARLRVELGLERPLPMQYLTWMGEIARADFGNSLASGRLVSGEILHRLPLTLQLALMAEVIAIAIGIPIGLICAVRQDTWGDYTLRFWSIFFLALPSFWIGLVIILVMVRVFEWMPPTGHHLLWDDPRNNILQLIWPALVLASHELARIARMSRSTMLEVLREDYIRTARAKGLAEQVVLVRHALKNSLIPVITFTSVYFGHLLAGTVVMEQVFSIPGLGMLFLDSLRLRDYTIIQALVLFFVTAFIVINLIVDLLYGWLDPRISYK